mmetsp:Transcript_110023/g.321803  ORF Transcript_110023/g.321803 Transcript_110023/m.321803 type:complete len:279 (-) Transcript_110023:799-1635(-)
MSATAVAALLTTSGGAELLEAPPKVYALSLGSASAGATGDCVEGACAPASDDLEGVLRNRTFTFFKKLRDLLLPLCGVGVSDESFGGWSSSSGKASANGVPAPDTSPTSAGSLTRSSSCSGTDSMLGPGSSLGCIRSEPASASSSAPCSAPAVERRSSRVPCTWSLTALFSSKSSLSRKAERRMDLSSLRCARHQHSIRKVSRSCDLSAVPSAADAACRAATPPLSVPNMTSVDSCTKSACTDKDTDRPRRARREHQTSTLVNTSSSFSNAVLPLSSS